MRRLREHVHRLDGGQPVAAGQQRFAILRQGGRIAGDVDEPLRLGGEDGPQQTLVAAGARRVDDDDVGAVAVLHPAGKQRFGLSGIEGGVRAAAAIGILAGVLDGLRDDLDAAHLGRIRSQPEGDRARPAVGVDNPFPPAQGRGHAHRLVQLQRLLRVELEEGARRQREFHVAERVLHRRLAPENAGLVAEHERRLARVDIVRDGGQVGYLPQQLADELVALRQRLRASDERQLQVVGLEAGPHDDRADDAAAAFHVIRRNVQPLQNRLDLFDRLIDAVMLDRAARNIDELVGLGLVQAGHDAAVPSGAELQLGFVPVVPRIVHAQHWLQRQRIPFDAGIAAERLPHQLLLCPELALVSEMLQLAATAALVDRTRRLAPVRRFLLVRRHGGDDMLVVHCGYLRPHDLPWKSAVEEDGFFPIIADAFSVNADPLDRDDDAVANLHLLRRGIGHSRPRSGRSGTLALFPSWSLLRIVSSITPACTGFSFIHVWSSLLPSDSTALTIAKRTDGRQSPATRSEPQQRGRSMQASWDGPIGSMLYRASF